MWFEQLLKFSVEVDYLKKEVRGIFYTIRVTWFFVSE